MKRVYWKDYEGYKKYYQQMTHHPVILTNAEPMNQMPDKFEDIVTGYALVHQPATSYVGRVPWRFLTDEPQAKTIKTIDLPPMNEDTDMVITALTNIESLYLYCREAVKKSKYHQSLTNRIRRMLHEDKDYIKAMSGGADMRKVSAKHIANYFIDELATTPE